MNWKLEWQQFLPGIGGSRIIQTADDSYLILGLNASTQEGTNVFVNYESILVKTDSSGNVRWERTYLVEGSKPIISDIVCTKDGGYAIAGSLTAYSEIEEAKKQPCFIKLDVQGNILWSKTYPLSNLTAGGFRSLFQTKDETYVVVGAWRSTWDYHGLTATFLYELDLSGTLLLNKTIPTGEPFSIIPTNDQEFIVVGGIRRMGGGSTFSLVKVNMEGNIIWSKEYKPDNAVQLILTMAFQQVMAATF